jgi:hypothetical protein
MTSKPPYLLFPQPTLSRLLKLQFLTGVSERGSRSPSGDSTVHRRPEAGSHSLPLEWERYLNRCLSSIHHIETSDAILGLIGGQEDGQSADIFRQA